MRIGRDVVLRRALVGGVLLLCVEGCGRAAENAKSVSADLTDKQYCAVTSDFVPASVCDALQVQAKRERGGRAALNAPNPMKRGEKATVWLQVADAPPPIAQASAHPKGGDAMRAEARPPAPSPEPPLAPPDDSTPSPPPQAQTPVQLASAMPGHTEAFTLTVGDHMAAELIGDVGFSIKPRTPLHQPVHLGFPYPSTQWGWDVTALHGGPHVLTVTTTVEGLDSSGKYYPLISTPRSYSFTVIVTPLEKIQDAIETAPGWIKDITAVVTAITALVAAVVGFRAAVRKWGSRPPGG